VEKFSHPSHQSHHISSFNIKNLLASPLEEVHTIYHLSLQFLSLHKKTNKSVISVISINLIRVCFLFIFFQGSFFSKNEKTLKNIIIIFVIREQHLLFPKLLVHQTFIFSVINYNLHPIFSLPHSLTLVTVFRNPRTIFFSFQNNTGSEN